MIFIVVASELELLDLGLGPALRTLTSFLSKSNQKGAPIIIAKAVTVYPRHFEIIRRSTVVALDSVVVSGSVVALDSVVVSGSVVFSKRTDHPIGESFNSRTGLT